MIDRLRTVVLVAWAFAWLRVTVANATTVVPPTFEDLVDRADLVFVGKVVKSRATWRTVGTNQFILTQVEFEAQEVLKGYAADGEPMSVKAFKEHIREQVAKKPARE